MKHVNKHYDTILSLLETCRTMRELKQLHCLMITTSVIKDIIPLRKLIDFCATRESGNLNYAKSVFSQIHQPSINIWNSMIKGYSKSDTPHETFFLYREMLQRGHPPDHFTYPFVLKACSVVYDVEFGMCIHNHVLKTGFEVNVYVSTCLLNLYVSCEDMKTGLQVFDKIPKWNVVAWTTLIAGYVNSDSACEAIKVFKDMENFNVEPNEITMTNVLIASSRSRDLATGKWAHNRVCELGYDPFESRSSRDVILATAIFDMYAKCGCLKVARDLFNKLPRRKLVAWNSMIAAYNQYGQAEEALGIFSEMRFSGFDPDKATFLSVIGAPAKLGALALGQSLHAYVSKLSLDKDVAIRTALLDMYAKIGDAKTAWRIFQDLQTKDAIAWTSMIMGLAMHGHGEEALSTFKRMQEDPNVTPDQITYIGVLCACSNDGLVEEGKRHFAEMSEIYGILPSIEHYGCMVDLLSRAGCFEEAERLVEQMPFKPDAAVWEALLNGCEIYENVKLANLVRSRLGELEPLAS